MPIICTFAAGADFKYFQHHKHHKHHKKIAKNRNICVVVPLKYNNPFFTTPDSSQPSNKSMKTRII